jgi:hypothetical protein
MNDATQRFPLGKFSTESFEYSNEFLNDGGRLVVMPRSLLRAWHGSIFWWTEPLRGHWGSRIAEFFEDRLVWFTDAESAHRTREWFDLIRVGKGQAIVVGRDYDEVNARWLRTLPEGLDYLVATVASDPRAESAVAEFVRNLPEGSWRDLGLRVNIPEDDMLLFHTGSSGGWLDEVDPDQPAVLGQGFAWTIPTGTYALYETEMELTEPGRAAEGAVCWLRRV